MDKQLYCKTTSFGKDFIPTGSKEPSTCSVSMQSENYGKKQCLLWLWKLRFTNQTCSEHTFIRAYSSNTDNMWIKTV